MLIEAVVDAIVVQINVHHATLTVNRFGSKPMQCAYRIALHAQGLYVRSKAGHRLDMIMN
jgi:hypothetical protein